MKKVSIRTGYQTGYIYTWAVSWKKYLSGQVIKLVIYYTCAASRNKVSFRSGYQAGHILHLSRIMKKVSIRSGYQAGHILHLSRIIKKYLSGQVIKLVIYYTWAASWKRYLSGQVITLVIYYTWALKKSVSEPLRKHAYIVLTPLNPLLYSETGVYRGIHHFSYFCSKT